MVNSSNWVIFLPLTRVTSEATSVWMLHFAGCDHIGGSFSVGETCQSESNKMHVEKT